MPCTKGERERERAYLNSTTPIFCAIEIERKKQVGMFFMQPIWLPEYADIYPFWDGD